MTRLSVANVEVKKNTADEDKGYPVILPPV